MDKWSGMTSVWYIFSLILSSPTYCEADDSEYFIDPTSSTKNAEHYSDKLGRDFVFYTTRLTRTEASVICNIIKGHLVTIIDETVGTFIAQALAESAITYEALWVGGQFDGTNWIWEKEKIVIPFPKNGTTFPMDRAPFWVEEPTLKKSEDKKCLAINRLNHDRYILVPMLCGLQRPFICQVAAQNVTKPIMQLPLIEGDERNYTLYYARYTWQEAVSFCNDNGMSLATLDFSNKKTVDFTLLSQRMLRSRPIIENVWIDGKYLDNQWKWVALNKAIATLAPGKLHYEPSDNDPPWFHGDNLYKAGCLLLDRHLCAEPVFVEARCDRQRSFVCQSNPSNEFMSEFEPIEGTDYWLSNVHRTWHGANERCRECFQRGATLLNLERNMDDDIALNAVVNLMTQRSVEIRHLWLAGHLDKSGKTWNWYLSDDVELLKPGSVIDSTSLSAVLNKTSNVQVTVECLTKNQDKDTQYTAFPCLNMDRENQRHVFMYGLRCNMKQSFICVSSYSMPCYCKKKIPKTTIRPSLVFDEETNQNIYLNDYKNEDSDYNEATGHSQHGPGCIGHFDEDQIDPDT